MPQVTGGSIHPIGVWIEFIAGELLGDELRISDVIVESLDDIVAVSVGAGSKIVLFESIRFSEPDQVQPVATPTLAVASIRK